MRALSPLAEAHDTSRFGGKASQLAAAMRAGLPVPTGIAVSWEGAERIAAGARELLDVALAALGDASFAVRSSAVDEDGAHASFAGQHLTRLGVRGSDSLIDAVRAVWASGRSPGALAYRARLGLRAPPRVAVVIQHMVHADSAGVMFTRCPMSGDDVRVIEAAWGLGESVVSGAVDPDRYRVARGGAALSITLGDKEIAIRANGEGEAREVPVDPHLRGRRCLGDAHLRALDRLAASCEAHFSGPSPHDIEWAFTGDTVHLLQRRPATR